MKSLSAGVAALGFLLGTGVALAQNGGMMNGDGMWGNAWMGGYGGFWMPVVLLVAVVGLVVWFMKQKSK